MTPKQIRFIDEYLFDMNATRAAIRAGYSAHTARSIAAENLAKPDIEQIIEDRIYERARRLRITSDEIVEILAVMARTSIGTFVTWKDNKIDLIDHSKIDPIKFHGLQMINVCQRGGISLAVTSKTRAIDLLGKHLRMWK